MTTPREGEVWWAQVETSRRPVVIVTRFEVIGVVSAVVVAPVTRTVREIPAYIPLGVEEGLSEVCVASFDNVQRYHRSSLTTTIGDLGFRRGEICEVVRAMTDCCSSSQW